MMNAKIKKELDGLRRAVNDYTEMAGDLAHMIDEIERELEDEDEPIENNYACVKNDYIFRERIMQVIFEDTDEREKYCWNQLLNLLVTEKKNES